MRDNYLVWRAQFLPAIRGARLLGILDGSTIQPSPTIKVKNGDGGRDGGAAPPEPRGGGP